MFEILRTLAILLMVVAEVTGLLAVGRRLGLLFLLAIRNHCLIPWLDAIHTRYDFCLGRFSGSFTWPFFVVCLSSGRWVKIKVGLPRFHV